MFYGFINSIFVVLSEYSRIFNFYQKFAEISCLEVGNFGIPSLFLYIPFTFSFTFTMEKPRISKIASFKARFHRRIFVGIQKFKIFLKVFQIYFLKRLETLLRGSCDDMFPLLEVSSKGVHR